MKKIITVIASLCLAFGIISCANSADSDLKTKYEDDEKKITKAEIKISIPDDGIPEENYYSYVPYEYLFQVLDSEGNNVGHGEVKPGSSCKLKLPESGIYWFYVEVNDIEGSLISYSSFDVYLTKGKQLKGNVEYNDVTGRCEFSNDKGTPKLLPYISSISYMSYMNEDGTAGQEWPYVEFGEWPQSEKDPSVEIDLSEMKFVGMHSYYRGSDGEWYRLFVEGGNFYYYKVEPIKWRILNRDTYASTGKALLLAENILTAEQFYEDINIRNGVNGEQIYPSNYKESRIRAFLNGLWYDGYYNDDFIEEGGIGIGFLQTAFTQKQIDKILITTVDNSPESGGIYSSVYACEDTEDKIFLLSFNELINTDYGFNADYQCYPEYPRIHYVTDYAVATGITNSSGYGAYYWTRSPWSSNEIRAVWYDGDASLTKRADVKYGVVPALWVKLQ